MSFQKRNSGDRFNRRSQNNNRSQYRGGSRSQRGNNGGQRSTISRADLISKSTAQQPTQAVKVETRSFSVLDLPPRLHQSIEAKQYQQMTPIQDAAIEPILSGSDVMGIANTGTGKTAAFLIPILARLHEHPKQKVLIVAPTRELAIQIDTELRSLRGDIKAYSVVCIGGTSLYNQVTQLNRGYSVVVGTPGRIKDLIDRRKIDMDQFKLVVLDEVDRMLDMGFVHDMRRIFDLLPAERQSLFFSATVAPAVKQLVNEFSKNIQIVSVKQEETTANVDQDVVEFTSNQHKIDLLHALLETVEVEKVLIFGRTKRGVNTLAATLQDRGFNTDTIHGNKNQSQRQRALLRFRRDDVNILVATDVAARGLDIQGVTHVINYDLPDNYEDYVHRIGRTGRADKLGKALSFVRK